MTPAMHGKDIPVRQQTQVSLPEFWPEEYLIKALFWCY